MLKLLFHQPNPSKVEKRVEHYGSYIETLTQVHSWVKNNLNWGSWLINNNYGIKFHVCSVIVWEHGSAENTKSLISTWAM